MLLVSAIHSDTMPKFARSLAPLISTAIAVPSSTRVEGTRKHVPFNIEKEVYHSVTSSDMKERVWEKARAKTRGRNRSNRCQRGHNRCGTKLKKSANIYKD